MDALGKINIGKLTKTKIVCTLGPASSTPEVIEQMIQAGMDVARLNFSHGDHEDHRKLFNLLRQLSAKYDNQVSIACDIQGPKIRTGKMTEPFFLGVGDVTKVTPEKIEGTKSRFQIKYATILKDLHEGDIIFINDGVVKMKVTGKDDTDLTCVVEAAGYVSDFKGCNIPSGNISLSVVTEKDERDLEFIASLDPEYVAASFIGCAADVQKVRACLEKYGNYNIKIISKIERPVAVKNLDEIIQASDVLMVARGDLGVEIPAWDVPKVQKEMVKKCNKQGRPVIVATQMLESMTTQSRPTRAEASDVFNAVLDGADAVMLSAESATGKYPVESVKIMDNIIEAAEDILPTRNAEEFSSASPGTTETIARSTFDIVKNLRSRGVKGKLLVIADSGYTVKVVSKFRPLMAIIAVCTNERTARELNIVWGVRVVLLKEQTGLSAENRFIDSINQVHKLGLLDVNDTVVCVTRSVMGKHVGTVNAIYHVKKVLSQE